MALGQKQEEFTVMIAKLILWGDSQGYKMRLGEGFNQAGIGHKKNSNHYIKLAQDIFIYKFGEYEQDMEAHKRMHDAWDTMGGAPRIEKDMNHYSVIWEGRW
jgi:hypothetical protein